MDDIVVEYLPALKCQCGFNYEGGQKKSWLVADCRGCWQCLICKGMGYCYEHRADHRFRFTAAVSNHPLWLLTAAKKKIAQLETYIKTLEKTRSRDGAETNKGTE